MFKATQISKISKGDLFSTADEFDLIVRRKNQDLDKLVILARRNKTKIHDICLLQAREKSRVRIVNRNKTDEAREKPRVLCKASYVAL